MYVELYKPFSGKVLVNVGNSQEINIVIVTYTCSVFVYPHVGKINTRYMDMYNFANAYPTAKLRLLTT